MESCHRQSPPNIFDSNIEYVWRRYLLGLLEPQEGHQQLGILSQTITVEHIRRYRWIRSTVVLPRAMGAIWSPANRLDLSLWQSPSNIFDGSIKQILLLLIAIAISGIMTVMLNCQNCWMYLTVASLKGFKHGVTFNSAYILPAIGFWDPLTC